MGFNPDAPKLPATAEARYRLAGNVLHISWLGCAAPGTRSADGVSWVYTTTEHTLEILAVGRGVVVFLNLQTGHMLPLPEAHLTEQYFVRAGD